MSDYNNEASYRQKIKKNRKKQNNPQDKQENACNFILTLYRRSTDCFI